MIRIAAKEGNVPANPFRKGHTGNTGLNSTLINFYNNRSACAENPFGFIFCFF
jgi:hypothetical protein